jgi:hypothetical protein
MHGAGETGAAQPDWTHPLVRAQAARERADLMVAWRPPFRRGGWQSAPTCDATGAARHAPRSLQRARRGIVILARHVRRYQRREASRRCPSRQGTSASRKEHTLRGTLAAEVRSQVRALVCEAMTGGR